MLDLCSALNFFSFFPKIIDKIDSKNSELYMLGVVGDMNFDLLCLVANGNTLEILEILTFVTLLNLLPQEVRVAIVYM